MKALQDKVIIMKIVETQKTEAGIFLAEAKDPTTSRGRVVGVGEGYVVNDKIVPLTVKVGDIVAFPHFAGVDLMVNGQKISVIVEKDILVVE